MCKGRLVIICENLGTCATSTFKREPKHARTLSSWPVANASPKFWTQNAHHEIGARRGSETEQQPCRLETFDQRNSLQQDAVLHCLLLQLGIHGFNLTHRSTQDHHGHVSANWCHLSTTALGWTILAASVSAAHASGHVPPPFHTSVFPW